MPEYKTLFVWVAQTLVYGLIVALYRKYDYELKRKDMEIKDLMREMAELRESVHTQGGQILSFEALQESLKDSILSLETRINLISTNMVTKQDFALLINVIQNKG